MKTRKLLAIASFVMLLAIALPVSAATTPDPVPAKTEDARAQQLIQRLEEIKAMNKSDLSSSERKELRKEVKGIKKEMKAIKGGVYLSAGAIIVIVLVLILIL